MTCVKFLSSLINKILIIFHYITISIHYLHFQAVACNQVLFSSQQEQQFLIYEMILSLLFFAWHPFYLYFSVGEIHAS